jgi:hypothetical protein
MFISIILILVLFQIRMAGKRGIGGMAQKKLKSKKKNILKVFFPLTCRMSSDNGSV